MNPKIKYLMYFMKERPNLWIGVVIVLITLLLIPFAPFLTSYPPEQAFPEAARQAPSMAHWFGTDDLGMDIFSRVIHAPRTDLVIALIAVSIALFFGLLLGVLVGYYEGVFGEVVMRIADLIQSFPVFILGMALVSMTGQNISNVIYALAIIICPQFLRLVRSQALVVKQQPYIEAARCIGNSDLKIILKHLLPNSISPALVHASTMIGFSMLLTAGLSFVGAGVRVPIPEWGSMISIGAPSVITGQWWSSLFPGLALGITVLGWAVVGDGLRELLDPTKRR